LLEFLTNLTIAVLSAETELLPNIVYDDGLGSDFRDVFFPHSVFQVNRAASQRKMGFFPGLFGS
jgi:hypothetical protein